MWMQRTHRFEFSKSLVLKKFVNPLVTDSAEASHKIHFRMSFYDYAFDKISGPINFSEQKELLLSPGAGQVALDEVNVAWTAE